MEQTADAAGFVRDRTEREREPGLLEEAVAIEEHPHLLEIAALARPRGGIGVADHRERGGPALAKVLAHRLGMLRAADGPIAVVVDLHVTGTPGQRDRRVGSL